VEADKVAAALGVELVERFRLGEGAGAYEVRRADGSRAVLKFGIDGDANYAIVAALRARGYPAPEIYAHGEFDGTYYELIERVAGEPLEGMTVAWVPRVVALVDQQRDTRVPGRMPWVDDIVGSLLEGRDGYCELPSIRAAYPALLTRLQRIAEQSRGVAVATTDAVHFDLSPGNIIADGDRITGIVDWQGATSGDAAFDLVTMAFFTDDRAIQRALLTEAHRRTDPRALPLYVAHMVLRQVDWSLRYHAPEHVEWNVALGTTLLADVDA
jgi:aminoglycoside phosphotransferase (APT) family kinase protein